VGGQKKHKIWDSSDCGVPQVRYPFQTTNMAALFFGVRMPQGEAHNLPYPVLTSSWHSTVPHQLVREQFCSNQTSHCDEHTQLGIWEVTLEVRTSASSWTHLAHASAEHSGSTRQLCTKREPN